jgi:hypothetical protein
MGGIGKSSFQAIVNQNVLIFSRTGYKDDKTHKFFNVPFTGEWGGLYTCTSIYYYH